MATNNLEIIIKAQDYASKELKKIDKQVKWMKWTFKKTWKSISDFWTRNAETFKKIWVWVWIAGVAIWVMGKKFLDLWTQIQQTQNKANIVFWDYIWDVKKIAKETSVAMWLSQNEYLNAAAWIQDLLIPMWFAREEATKMSTDMVWLAWALSEWSAWQYTAAETSTILAKAMLWETEQLKSMWIQVDVSSKQFNKRIKLAMSSTGATLQQAKALDIQKQILEKSTDAQDAFKKGWDSLVRQQAELTAKIKNTRDAIAIALIPTMNKLLKTLEPHISKLSESTTAWFENTENVKKFEWVIENVITVIKSLWKFLMLLVKAWNIVWKAIWYVVADIVIKISSLKELWPKAYEWGVNLINMFTDWIKSWKNAIVNSVEWVAESIADYLGFHSPTKKWPASDSDKWIPNLMKMLSQWFENWTADIKKAVTRVSQWIKDSFSLEEIKWVLQVIQVNAIATFENMSSSLVSQKEKVNGLYKEYQNLEKQIKWIDKTIEWLKWQWETDIATRAVQLSKELLDVKKQIKSEEDETKKSELLALQQKLRVEMLLATSNTTQAEMEKVRIENAKSETEKILDRINIKIQEAQAEKTRIQELMILKKEEIRSEFEVHKAMVDAKIILEQQYFDLFSSRIKKQQSEVQSVITKMKTLLSMQWSNNNNGWISWERANWWPVTWWKTYLVWERWPELFTPPNSWKITANNKLWWSANISINMWGVTVNNSADENRLVEKIKRALVVEAKMFNLWIS